MRSAGTAASPGRIPVRAIRVRWIIFLILFGFAFMAYIQRTSITVAAERMMPELGLSQEAIGWVTTAYLLSYTIFQFPGGVLGEILGARRMLAGIGLLALAATAATALAPLAASGLALLLGLLAARFVFGISQAPIFPVCSGVIEGWFPQSGWGLPQGLLASGLNLGSAVATPITAFVMVTFGWQAALAITSLPLLLVIGIWWSYGRDRASEHSAVSVEELGELGACAAHAPRVVVTLKQVLVVLMSREILLLSLSYLLMNYLFYLLSSWGFLYLVQERHLSVQESGLLDSLPYLAAAAGAWAGGSLADRSRAWLGILWGFRLVPLVALPVAGLALYLAIMLESPYGAVAALCVAFAAIEMTEGPYWACSTQVARQDTMIASAILNTGGNLGGVIGVPIMASLSGSGHWSAAFLTGSGCALAAAILWLGVDARRETIPADPP